MNRRGFLALLAGAIAAPFVKAADKPATKPVNKPNKNGDITDQFTFKIKAYRTRPPKQLLHGWVFYEEIGPVYINGPALDRFIKDTKIDG